MSANKKEESVAKEKRGRARRYTIKRKLEILARVRKEAAKEGGLSVGEIARAEGCSTQAIYGWLADKRYSTRPLIRVGKAERD